MVLAVVLIGRIAPGVLPRLVERLRVLLEVSDAETVLCDLGAIAEPDAALIDLLARLQLEARRSSLRIRFLGASDETKDLLELVGLENVVPCEELSLEPRGQAEQREPSGGVEEEGDPPDTVA